MMWLSRITEVLDCFPPPSPQKWEAHACSKGSSYSVLGLGLLPRKSALLVREAQMTSPSQEAKGIMDCTELHVPKT